MEDERQTNVVRAYGADELRLHQAHAYRRPYRLGSGDHGRRPPLRLDLLRRRAASLETWPAEEESSLSELAHALCISRIRRGAAMDAKESGPVGEDGRHRREAADGRIVRHQLAL